MKIGWKHLASIAVATVAGGMLIAWLGVIDIRASSGHWRVTDWFLHWVMRSSVRTAALGIEVPDLGNPAYLPLAAGHYEAGCAYCHGSPESEPSPVARGMLPPPPALNEVVGEWTDAQLFVIVKDGVRYTGMPAWPAAGRDDEVWAMVAFLRRYPDLDAATYRRLRGGVEPQPAASKNALLASCNACHAPDRLAEGSLIPSLEGQSETYLRQSLAAFSTRRRESGVMQTAAHTLDEAAIAELAEAYAAGRAPDPGNVEPPTLVTRGDPRRGVPACNSCHDRLGLNPAYPRLSGLSRDYISSQLDLFRAGTRGGGPFHHLMIRAAKNLTDEDIRALAEHYGR